jgi:hypothetical protein
VVFAGARGFLTGSRTKAQALPIASTATHAAHHFLKELPGIEWPFSAILLRGITIGIALVKLSEQFLQSFRPIRSSAPAVPFQQAFQHVRHRIVLDSAAALLARQHFLAILPEAGASAVVPEFKAELLGLAGSLNRLARLFLRLQGKAQQTGSSGGHCQHSRDKNSRIHHRN